MKLKCHEIELYLTDFLENSLTEADFQTVCEHLELCTVCGLLFKEMQASLSLCRSYLELEPPARLIENILEQTSGRYQSLSCVEYLRELFRPIYSTPRFAVGTCLAVISWAMVMNATGITLRDIEWMNLNPKAVFQNVNRTINLAYDNGVRRINDLKILYQIQSKIDELRTQETETPPLPEEKSKRSSKPQQHSATEHLKIISS